MICGFWWNFVKSWIQERKEKKMELIEIYLILNNGWMIHGLKKLESMEENGSYECQER